MGGVGLQGVKKKLDGPKMRKTVPLQEYTDDECLQFSCERNTTLYVSLL